MSDEAQGGWANRERWSCDACMEWRLPANVAVSCRQFKSERGLKTHIHMVHELMVASMSSTSGRITCRACGASFGSAQKLEAHERRAHLLLVDNASHGDGSSADERSALTREHHKRQRASVCEQCGCEFDTEQKLVEHFGWHVPRQEQHACTQCCRSFPGARALQQHLAMSACSKVDDRA